MPLGVPGQATPAFKVLAYLQDLHLKHTALRNVPRWTAIPIVTQLPRPHQKSAMLKQPMAHQSVVGTCSNLRQTSYRSGIREILLKQTVLATTFLMSLRFL